MCLGLPPRWIPTAPPAQIFRSRKRPGDEIKELYFERPTALAQTKCYNPAFDVTDHNLITAIITDKGILRPPYTESLRALFQEEV